MNRNHLLVVLLIVLTVIAAAGWLRSPPVIEQEETPKPTIMNVSIGVIPGFDDSYDRYRFLANLAQGDINTYCADKNLPYRFSFNLSAPVTQTPQVLTYTKQFHEAGVNIVLGYEWSSHLCSGARVYGYNKTMVLMTPSATSSVYALRNNTMYHLCVLDFEPIETTLKAMSDRGVKAYLLLYPSDYGGMEYLASMISSKTGTPKFEENTTLTYSVEAPLDDVLDRGDKIIGDMIAKYGKEQTAVFWFKVPPQVYNVGAGEDPFLLAASSRSSLSSVTWYSYEDTPSPSTIENPSADIAAKLRLISVQQAPPVGLTYERVKSIWKNSTGFDLGYYTAVAYDGFWVLSLSVIEANSTKPMDIMRVLPSVAASYVGASGRCTLGDYGARMGADYDIRAYFEVEGRAVSLRCGSYDWENDSFTWDNILIR